jgi:hypothetical protein
VLALPSFADFHWRICAAVVQPAIILRIHASLTGMQPRPIGWARIIAVNSDSMTMLKT